MVLAESTAAWVTLAAALGLALPSRIGRRAQSGDIQAICLGPVEWTLHCAESLADGFVAACADVYRAHPHSLIDVSGREATHIIDGTRAVELLTLCCPRDLDGIAVGEGRPINLNGVTVVFWHDGENHFRLDVWHSFAADLLHLLETGCRELAAEMLPDQEWNLPRPPIEEGISGTLARIGTSDRHSQELYRISRIMLPFVE